VFEDAGSQAAARVAPIIANNLNSTAATSKH